MAAPARPRTSRQNRVDPFGAIVAVPERGTFMGNRGILHDGCGRLGRARWTLKAWLICRTAFNGRRRQIMAPRRYTELFFLDEATALAAGHRPCFECRRADFLAYRDAWARGTGWCGDAPPRVADMDGRLHAERVDPRGRTKRTWTSAAADLPEGTMIVDPAAPGRALLLAFGVALPWSFSGYGPPRPRPAGDVAVLTPASSVAALAAGYRPVLHPTVREAPP